MEIAEIKKLLEKAFKNKAIRDKIVIMPRWQHFYEIYKIPTIGFCFTATDIIYKLTGAEKRWRFMEIHERDWKDGGTHYYLIEKATGMILDITQDTYYKRDVAIPYYLGKEFKIKPATKKHKLFADSIKLVNIAGVDKEFLKEFI